MNTKLIFMGQTKLYQKLQHIQQQLREGQSTPSRATNNSSSAGSPPTSSSSAYTEMEEAWMKINSCKKENNELFVS